MGEVHCKSHIDEVVLGQANMRSAASGRSTIGPGWEGPQARTQLYGIQLIGISDEAGYGWPATPQ